MDTLMPNSEFSGENDRDHVWESKKQDYFNPRLRTTCY